MRTRPQIVLRSVSDLKQETGLAACKLKALLANPYLKSAADLGKIVGFCDSVEAGGEYVFPLKIQTPKGEFEVLAGSTLNVDPKFRRSGLGMDLPELRWEKSPSGVAMGAGLSQMAVPVHQLLDYHIFLLPRHLMLWKSRSVVEMKLWGGLARIAAAAVDLCIGLYATVLRCICAVKLAGCRGVAVAADDANGLKTVADLIAQNGRAYSEVHDEAWFKWHLTESFSKDGSTSLRLIYKGERPLAFYMVKRRFHEQASHRGFKNVWLGSIIEWEAASDCAKQLPWVLLSAALELRKLGCDAVELPTDDVALASTLRKLGWRTVGEGNFVIKAGPMSPLASDEGLGRQEQWRLRPAMGDNGLS